MTHREVGQLVASLVGGPLFLAAGTLVLAILGELNRKTFRGLVVVACVLTVVTSAMLWQNEIVSFGEYHPLELLSTVLLVFSVAGWLLVRHWERIKIFVGGDLAKKGFSDRRFIANRRQLVVAIWGGINLLGILGLAIYLLIK